MPDWLLVDGSSLIFRAFFGVPASFRSPDGKPVNAVRGFMDDLERIGRADQVAVMIFTEFGRRVEENGSLGTDHGTATPMFVIGKGVKGGFYGRHPSLTDLDDGNMKMTTDFRSVYATMIKEWLGYDDTAAVLKGEFRPLGVFA